MPRWSMAPPKPMRPIAATFDAILYEAIEERRAARAAGRPLVAELQERIRKRSYQLAIERGDMDVTLSTMRFAPDKTLMGAIAVYAMQKIVAKLYGKMALKVGAKTALKGTAATLLGPLGWVVVGASVLCGTFPKRASVVQAAQDELQRIYQRDCRDLQGGTFVATPWRTSSRRWNSSCTRPRGGRPGAGPVFRRDSGAGPVLRVSDIPAHTRPGRRAQGDQEGQCRSSVATWSPRCPSG